MEETVNGISWSYDELLTGDQNYLGYISKRITRDTAVHDAEEFCTAIAHSAWNNERFVVLGYTEDQGSVEFVSPSLNYEYSYLTNEVRERVM